MSADRPILAGLLPDSVIVVEADAAMWQTPAFAEEEQALGNASASRLAEFRAGRHAARAALQQLNSDEFPASQVIARQADGSPRWPVGIVGCITHTAGFCAAALTRASTIRALGIDAERRQPLRPAARQRILRAEETRAIAVSGLDDDLAALLIFSAKECVQKVAGALSLPVPDFRDIRIEPDFAAGEFSVSCAALAHDALPAQGRWGFDVDRVYSSLLIKQSAG